MTVTSEDEEDSVAQFDRRSDVCSEVEDDGSASHWDGDGDDDEDDDEDEDDDDDDNDDDDDDGDDDDGPLPPPPFMAPPFYGRPPTPLPPSPSLTSLLRPSRPTTPDASDDEGLEPVPRASPKVPTYEYYGFVLYLFSSLTFAVWLLWSYLPSPFLHALGIYYYPTRWWALAVPSFLVVAVAYIYVALAAYNVEMLTLPPSHIETMVDDAAQIALVDARGRLRAHTQNDDDHDGRRAAAVAAPGPERRRRARTRTGTGTGTGETPGACIAPGPDWRDVWNKGTDGVMDIPLAGVCEILYGGDGGDEDVGLGVGVGDG